MTETLTTAEVRLAATTNLDLPLTLYKKLETGFDVWLESVRAEAREEVAKKAISDEAVQQSAPSKRIIQRAEYGQGSKKTKKRSANRARKRENLRNAYPVFSDASRIQHGPNQSAVITEPTFRKKGKKVLIAGARVMLPRGRQGEIETEDKALLSFLKS
jgi:hypothetical protein